MGKSESPKLFLVNKEFIKSSELPTGVSVEEPAQNFLNGIAKNGIEIDVANLLRPDIAGLLQNYVPVTAMTIIQNRREVKNKLEVKELYMLSHRPIAGPKIYFADELSKRELMKTERTLGVSRRRIKNQFKIPSEDELRTALIGIYNDGGIDHPPVIGVVVEATTYDELIPKDNFDGSIHLYGIGELSEMTEMIDTKSGRIIDFLEKREANRRLYRAINYWEHISEN